MLILINLISIFDILIFDMHNLQLSVLAVLTLIIAASVLLKSMHTEATSASFFMLFTGSRFAASPLGKKKALCICNWDAAE